MCKKTRLLVHSNWLDLTHYPYWYSLPVQERYIDVSWCGTSWQVDRLDEWFYPTNYLAYSMHEIVHICMSMGQKLIQVPYTVSGTGRSFGPIWPSICILPLGRACSLYSVLEFSRVRKKLPQNKERPANWIIIISKWKTETWKLSLLRLKYAHFELQYDPS